MRIGIYGKAGTGKSTFVNLIKNPEYEVIHCDDLVAEAYKTNKNIIDFVKEHYPKCVFQNRVDKDKLIKVLIKDEEFKRVLALQLYRFVFKDIIDKNDNIIMDGIVPRYAKHFDLVLKAECDEEDRIKRLKEGRGLTIQRIKQIDQLQKGW